MACCFFPSSSSSSSSRFSSKAINNVRVVDLNGYVEEFDYPVSVSQVTGRPPKYFVFTAAQLMSSSIKPLKSETLRQPGHIYFLLPCSALQTDVSPLGLETIVEKMTEKAKFNRSSLASKSSPDGKLCRKGERKREWEKILEADFGHHPRDVVQEK